VELTETTQDTLNLVLQVGVPVLALAAALLIIAIVGKQWVHLWQEARGYVPDVIELIDEPTDPVIRLTKQYAPALVPWLMQQGPVFLRSVADALDRLAEIQTAPEPETGEPGGAAK